MKDVHFKMLSDSEKELVLAARPKKLRDLDEDELLDLHKRVRKARNKYSGLHRRRAGAQVGKDRARGKAGKKHQRVAAKAEVFEEVLARVSQHLSVAARRSSEALKEQRLAAAARGRSDTSGSRRRPRRDKGRKGPNRRSRERRSIERRRTASARSAKRRHEARRR